MPDLVINGDFPQTPNERWLANIAAIRLAKRLSAENRRASPAEQRTLGMYSGFGDSAYEPIFKAAAAIQQYGEGEGRYHDPRVVERANELRGTVSDEEFDSIERSRLNAFFTSKPVIDAMWQGLREMGVGTGKVLEPSAGSGRFLGLQPEDMAEQSQRTAVELDALTSEILQHAYPDTRVYGNTGFEAVPLPNDSFDVAISNVPFGDVRIHDPEYNASGRKQLTRYVHNYFFAKALDKLKPGGVLAFITTHGTMDAPAHEGVRRYLSERSDLLGAVRLPRDAFPDTDVVTDVIYLRKRSPEEGPGDDSWVESVPEQVPYEDRYGRRLAFETHVNRYYRDNPDRVLGTPTLGSMRGGLNEYSLVSSPDNPVERALPSAIGEIADRGKVQLAANLLMERPAEAEQQPLPAEPAPKRTPAEARRHAELAHIRELARRLLDTEAASTDQEQVDAARAALKAAYDAYTTKNESINTPANQRLMSGEKDSALLFSLETYDREAECWQPAAIMYRRTIGATVEPRIANVQDALIASVNRADLDFDWMARQLGDDRTGNDVRDELEQQELIFRTPEGKWVSRERYLSGNVREKLRAASLAAQIDPTFAPNVAALQRAQPKPVVRENLMPTSENPLGGTRLGAPWIPEEIVNDFIRQTLQPSYGEKWVTHSEDTEAYIAEVEKVNEETGKVTKSATRKNGSYKGGWRIINPVNSRNANIEWGVGEKRRGYRVTPIKDAQDVLNAALNGTSVTIRDPETKQIDQGMTAQAQQKVDELRRLFSEWVWEEPARAERVVREYNERHNATVPREFDGSKLTFPGMAAKWQSQLRPYQRDAIARIIHDGTTLLAHEVGFGKTVTMVGGSMKRKQLGLANKPMFVVPKPTHEQFQKQFLDFYPGANILAPDNADFSEGNRDRLLNRIATGDWDAVIVTTEQFKSIPLKPETEYNWLRKQRDELKAIFSGADGQTRKDLAKKLQNYETQMREKLDEIARSKDAVHFEDMGVDALYVDEAHRYKNLPYSTAMDRVKGMPNSESTRAWDMYMKLRYLQEKAGTRDEDAFSRGGVVFATGTPVSNTIAETYTMMRYLQPDELERRGLGSFDAWANTYGNVQSGFEVTVTGNMRDTQRFAYFVNLPGLAKLWQHAADVRVASETPEMLRELPRLVNEETGEAQRSFVKAPENPRLKKYMELLAYRAEHLPKDPKEDNMLLISSDARKASLDLRMVDPDAPRNPNGKVPKAVENIVRIYREEAKDKGTQLVFLDLGIPKAREGTDAEADSGSSGEDLTAAEADLVRDVYNIIKRDLVAKGIPEHEIAFIHTAKDKDELFQKVRDGDVRVILGSTEKLGTGVNIQDRAAALHHLDIPWRPSDLEQREGRIVRPGNRYGPAIDEETGNVTDPGRGVRIFNYIQEGSFDSFMWQAIEAKSRPIHQLMKRELPEDWTVPDSDPLTITATQLKALASGNPLAVREAELSQRIQIDSASRSAYERRLREMRLSKKESESQVRHYTDVLPSMRADAEHVQGLGAKAGDNAEVGGKQFKRADAVAALVAALKKVPYGGSPKDLGAYKGFTVVGVNSDAGYQIGVTRPGSPRTYFSGHMDKDEIGSGIFTRADNLIKGIPDRVSKAEATLAEAQQSIGTYDAQMARPFAREAELEHAQRQLRVIQYRLDDENARKLKPGDDPEMDVYADLEAVQRSGPDADAVTLRTAVEAVEPQAQADTPKAVATELNEVLSDEFTAVNQPDAQTEPPAARPEEEDMARNRVYEGEELPRTPPATVGPRVTRMDVMQMTDDELAASHWRGRSDEDLRNLRAVHEQVIEDGFLSRRELREKRSEIAAIDAEIARRSAYAGRSEPSQPEELAEVFDAAFRPDGDGGYERRPGAEGEAAYEEWAEEADKASDAGTTLARWGQLKEDVGASDAEWHALTNVDRIRALAAIHPTRFATRLAERAESMDEQEAQEAIEDLTDLIESTNDPAKIGAMGRLASGVQSSDEMLAAAEHGPVALTGPGSVMERMEEERIAAARAQEEEAFERERAAAEAALERERGEPEPLETPAMPSVEAAEPFDEPEMGEPPSEPVVEPPPEPEEPMSHAEAREAYPEAYGEGPAGDRRYSRFSALPMVPRSSLVPVRDTPYTKATQEMRDRAADVPVGMYMDEQGELTPISDLPMPKPRRERHGLPYGEYVGLTHPATEDKERWDAWRERWDEKGRFNPIYDQSPEETISMEIDGEPVTGTYKEQIAAVKAAKALPPPPEESVIDALPDPFEAMAQETAIPDEEEEGELLDSDDDGMPDVGDVDDDHDGVPDALDVDDDGDGITDEDELPPAPRVDDGDVDAVDDAEMAGHDVDEPPMDTDEDGMPDAVDTDDDNDGIPDAIDVDDDGDGIADEVDEDHAQAGEPDELDQDEDDAG
ncbi:MAG: N-6 DNA methylase, partial [Chloroflexi bacterium]|nr:N-6 DNA methylase [Chloroflexota bacterium]